MAVNTVRDSRYPGADALHAVQDQHTNYYDSCQDETCIVTRSIMSQVPLMAKEDLLDLLGGQGELVTVVLKAPAGERRAAAGNQAVGAELAVRMPCMRT